MGQYEDDGGYDYHAEKNGFTFAASNPIELLGIIAVYEHVRPTVDEPYWWFVDGEDIQDELMERALERSLAELRERDPDRWQTEIVRAPAEADDKATAADRLGVSESELQRILNDPRLRAR